MPKLYDKLKEFMVWSLNVRFPCKTIVSLDLGVKEEESKFNMITKGKKVL